MQRLTCASNDAEALRDYFQLALPNGSVSHWTTLNRGKRKIPAKQVDVLRAVDSLSRDVPNGGGGLFYFSGHASVSQRGLVLKCYDAHDEFLEYTGLPLTRIFEILKRQAGARKHFLLILDCCRDGGDPAVSDDIPPNVCILYACRHGGTAYESESGGALTRSIIESLAAIANETMAKNCTVRSLCNRLGRELFAWRPSSALSIELYGTWADRFDLPIAGNAKALASNEVFPPSSVLRYGFGSKSELDQGIKAIAAAIFQWYGISYQSAAGSSFVREHLQFPTLSHRDHLADNEVEDESLETYVLSVRIPDGCERWMASEFVVHLLYCLPDIPQTLVLNWRKPVDLSVFKLFEHAIGGEWIGGGAASDTRLCWKHEGPDGRYRGVASVITEGAGTNVVLTCETVDDLYPMPLSYLLPKIQDVFDLFRYVRI